MIFRGIFRKFPENINKTLIAARPLSARDSCNVLCLFGFGVVDKTMFHTTRKVKKSKSKSQRRQWYCVCKIFLVNLNIMVRKFHFRVGEFLIDLDLDLDRLNLVSLFYLFH